MRLLPISLLLASLFPGPVLAQKAPKKKWKDEAEVSVVSTNGNSKTTTTSGKNAFRYLWDKTAVELTAEGLGTKSRNEVTAERYAAGEKFSYKLSDRNYSFEKFNWSKNRFAGIGNRWDISLGAGRSLFSLPKDKVIVELGFGYINEERIHSKREDFSSGRAYTRYTHDFMTKAAFLQDFEYLANFKGSEGYRLNTETSITAAVSAIFSVKFSYIWNKVNKPAPGFTKNDTTTKFSLIASF